MSTDEDIQCPLNNMDFWHCHLRPQEYYGFQYIRTSLLCRKYKYSWLSFYKWEKGTKAKMFYANKEKDARLRRSPSNFCFCQFLKTVKNHNAMMHFHTENDRVFPAWFTFSLCRSQVSADLPKQGHISVHIARITYISCSLSPFLAFSCFFHLISN